MNDGIFPAADAMPTGSPKVNRAWRDFSGRFYEACGDACDGSDEVRDRLRVIFYLTARYALDMGRDWDDEKRWVLVRVAEVAREARRQAGTGKIDKGILTRATNKIVKKYKPQGKVALGFFCELYDDL